MKSLSQALAVLASTFGLFSINFAVSLPAQAAVVCEPGTINHYQNGSLATCVLGQDMSVQVSSPTTGVASFECKAKNFISFDDKGQFTGCQLAQDVQLIKGNSVERCPAEYKIYVVTSTNGIQSISCSPY